jgi:RHS repeat-associated protein
MLKILVVKAMLRVTAAAAISLLVALGASAQTVLYVHTDGLGSVVLTTDQDRNIIERSEYEPYGHLMNHPLTDRPGYTGHVMDMATGLTYMQQRYYDEQIGRFLSLDPVKAHENPSGAFNRYWYANNNPYTNIDPDGRECNGNGCWVNSAERKAAESGNWREYYRLAGEGGDKYAQRAGEVASNSGSTALSIRLSGMTNKILHDSIAENMGVSPLNPSVGAQVAIEHKMEGIRVGLAKAHVLALDSAGASASNPVSLDRAVIGEFHKEVFKVNGADPKVFGGFKVDNFERLLNKVPGLTSRDVYDYCPSPSCKN